MKRNTAIFILGLVIIASAAFIVSVIVYQDSYVPPAAIAPESPDSQKLDMLQALDESSSPGPVLTEDQKVRMLQSLH